MSQILAPDQEIFWACWFNGNPWFFPQTDPCCHGNENLGF